MTKNQLADSLRMRLFADRGTDLDAAYQYVQLIHTAMPDEQRLAAMTAMHVLVNTIANCISELPDSLPATPETVTLPRADDPSRGSWSEYDLLMLINKTIESWFDDNVDIDHAVEEYIENSVDFTEIVRDELRGNLTLTVTVE